jgi:hypothetical protein
MHVSAFNRSAFLISLLCVLLAFFAPLVVIWTYEDLISGGAAKGTREATVGIGVILRATARRLARTGSGNILRTSFGAYMRAATRALTRRTVKIASRVAVASVTKDVSDAERDPEAEAEVESVELSNATRNALAVGSGFVGLFLSFYGILLVAPAEQTAKLTTDQGISHPVAACLGAVPLIVYAALNLTAGKLFDVRVRLQTAFDGLLLQGYFTGAGSFLPMTTDVHYEGEVKQKGKAAGLALAGVFIVHLILSMAALATGSETLWFASTTFLLYCFVCSFPIKPLEGYELWRASKLAWVLLWLPILAAFVSSLPEEFGAIL